MQDFESMNNRRLGGLKAKQVGSSWEKTLESVARSQGYSVVHLPDGCRQIGPRPKDLIRVKTPFDTVIANKKTVIFLDCKTTNENTFHSKLIKDHQINSLMSLDYQGWPTGYAIFFRRTNEIIFFNSKLLHDATVLGGSLKREDGTLLGTLLDFKLEKIYEQGTSHSDN